MFGIATVQKFMEMAENGEIEDITAIRSTQGGGDQFTEVRSVEAVKQLWLAQKTWHCLRSAVARYAVQKIILKLFSRTPSYQARLQQRKRQ